MVVGILDTSVIVDLIRGYPQSHEWLAGIDDDLGVTNYVWLEIIQGAKSKRKQQDAIDILADFTLIETTYEDSTWAVQALMKARLTHNVDALDSLIAAPSYRLQLPLYTRNMKHFTPLLGGLAQEPYT